MANPLKGLNDSIKTASNQDEDPSKKLAILEKSKESGLISQDEYEKEKSKISSEIVQFEGKHEAKIQ